MNSVQKCSGVSGDATWRAGTPCPEKNNNKIKKIIYNSLNFLFVYLFLKKIGTPLSKIRNTLNFYAKQILN